PGLRCGVPRVQRRPPTRLPGDRGRREEIRSIITTLAAAMTVSTSDRAGTVPSQERVCLPE
ncbi:MAG: hypothetical protein M3302_07055, partial [Actinomycetota bacterium]|nr:hypothetical protein [Actinomycetota bacterium]